MKYTSITILYNPNSTGSSHELAKTFKASITKRLPSQKVDLTPTKHPGHGEELAYSLAKSSKNPLIISSSGDGGYHEVVNGAMKAQREGHTPTTGLLPAGNANDHYHNLHSDDLVDLIVRGERTQIDLLKIKSTSKGKPIERYGHSYIGFGLTPIVGKELNKNKLNIFNQVWIVAKALLALKSVKLNINNKVRSYDSIVFSNVDRMSKVLKISQPSSVNDGKFEVTIFRSRSKLKLILQLFKTSIIAAKEDHQVDSYTLKTVDATLVQVDGEIISLDPTSEVRVTIEKQILHCIV